MSNISGGLFPFAKKKKISEINRPMHCMIVYLSVPSVCECRWPFIVAVVQASSGQLPPSSSFHQDCTNYVPLQSRHSFSFIITFWVIMKVLIHQQNNLVKIDQLFKFCFFVFVFLESGDLHDNLKWKIQIQIMFLII